MLVPDHFSKGPFAHTYSIVARDESTGEIGAGVQSHWFSVGSVVPWALAGVGAVVTQSFTNPAFGPQGLELLGKGTAPKDAVEQMVLADGGREYRQLALIDSRGRAHAHTGKMCVAEAGHIVGKNFSVQANMMLTDMVWREMADAFETSDGPLSERIMVSLEAAEKAGGDVRGRQSAAIVVVRAEGTGEVWKDRVIDLRVEDHADPLGEMRRLLDVHQAYRNMDAGDAAMEKGDMNEALSRYTEAESLFPENEEMVFWHAVALANSGHFEESVPLFKGVFIRNANWKIMLPRLVPSGLLKMDQGQLRKVIEDR
jgi:uncharacterized Ntn-hydrolase superfamily protein